MNNAKRLAVYVLFPFYIVLHLDLTWQAPGGFEFLSLFYISFPLWIICVLENEERRATFAVWYLGTHLAYFLFLLVMKYTASQAFSRAILTPMPLALGVALVRTNFKRLF